MPWHNFPPFFHFELIYIWNLIFLRYYYILNFNSSFTYKVVYKITPYNNVGMCGIWCSISNSYIHMTLYFDNVLSAERLQQQQPVFDLLLIKGNSCFFLGVLLTRSYMIFAPPTVNCSSNVHEFFFPKFARCDTSIHVVYLLQKRL